MELAARLDDYGKPAWIAVTILGFIVFWPIGLGILAYLLWSGRMGCWTKSGPGRWYGERNQSRRDGAGSWFGSRAPESSGNHAFDEYREETIRRLEEEQKAFKDFLERLRQAKDKAEFDQFMAERRQHPTGGSGQPGAEGYAPQG